MFCSPYNFVVKLNMISDFFFLNKSVFEIEEEEFQ